MRNQFWLTITNMEKQLKSLEKMRRWKKYKQKNLSPEELNRKREVANAQERRRMNNLNLALARLRRQLPLEVAIRFLLFSTNY